MPVPDTHTFSLQTVVDEIVLTGVDNPTFTGSGINDMQTGGNYTGSTVENFHVRIYSTGTPDQFQYAIDGGGWSTPINITGSWQTLTQGVQVKFGNIRLHTQYDQWDFECTNKDTLIQCFDESVDSYFDPSYGGSSYTGTGTGTDRLSNFRNYGWNGTLSYKRTYQTGNDGYTDIAEGEGSLSGYIFCVGGDNPGLVQYSISSIYYLNYVDNHHDGGIYGYNRVCTGGGYIYVLSGGNRLWIYSASSYGLTLEMTYYEYEYYDICYHDGHLWGVGNSAQTNKGLVTVWNVVISPQGLDVVARSELIGNYSEYLRNIESDGNEFVYVTSDFTGVRSFYLSVGTNIIQWDSDAQGGDYNNLVVDGNWLFIGVGTAAGPISYSLSNGNMTYKDIDDRNVIASGVGGLLDNMLFTAVGANGLYCDRVNVITGNLIFMDSDDQGGNYYQLVTKVVSGVGVIYVATSSGIRIYGYS